MEARNASAAHLPVDRQGPIACVLPQQLRQGCNSRVPDDNELIRIHKRHPLVPRPAGDQRLCLNVLKRHHILLQACPDKDYPSRRSCY